MSATANKKFFPPCLWPVLISALTWAVIFLAIPPDKQDFPLGDDWAFAHSAIWFAHGLGIHYLKWASMPQLGQWLWSWPFLHIVGLPHVALRLSTIVLSWLGLAAFCDLLQLEKVPARLAAFAACVLALNPLFFISQGTYMTDVPALSFGLIALDFYSRAMVAKNLRWLLAATILAVFAVITRQTMLAVPLAAALPALRNQDARRSAAWQLSIIVPVAVCVYAAWWFSRRPDVLAMRAIFSPRNPAYRPFVALHLAGLVVLPLCFLSWRRGGWQTFFGAFTAMLLAAGCYYLFAPRWICSRLFPYCPGMLSLEGTYAGGLVVGQRDILLTPVVQLILTILGFAGAVVILIAAWEMIRDRKFPSALLVFTLLQFFILMTYPFMMDRYAEVLFPGAIFLIAARCSQAGIGRFAGIAAAALSGLIAVALFHDWLAWNTARWDLGREAIAAKAIQPMDIEGGFEWNGWYGRNDPAWVPVLKDSSAADNDSASLLLQFSRSNFPTVTGRFALAFSQPTNAMVVATLPYSSWLPPEKKIFFLVQQKRE